MWNGTRGVCVCGGAVVQLGNPVSSNTSRSRCTRMRLVILSIPPDTTILNDDMHMVTLEPTLCRIHSHIRTHIITTIAVEHAEQTKKWACRWCHVCGVGTRTHGRGMDMWCGRCEGWLWHCIVLRVWW